MTSVLNPKMLDGIQAIHDECMDVLVERELQGGHGVILTLGEPFLEQIIAGKALRNIEHRKLNYATDDDLIDLINYATFQLLLRRGAL